MLPFYEAGRHLLIDVSVVSSLQAQLVDRVATDPGHALEHRYSEKWRKYGDACQAEGLVFRPLPFEVLGGMHQATVATIKRLGQSLARVGGQEEGQVINHLFGRLSILLMRGSTSLILSRQPTQPATHINGEF